MTGAGAGRASVHVTFRPDVEGLRAVAIAIVVLAHAEVGFGAGGYVGVDVFFVISGFLITQAARPRAGPHGARVAGAVLRAPGQAADAAGARRDRASSWSLASLLLSPVQADAVAADVMAAGATCMNWRLSAEAVDYFASGARPAARPPVVAGGRGAVLPRVAAAAARAGARGARRRCWSRARARSPSRRSSTPWPRSARRPRRPTTPPSRAPGSSALGALLAVALAAGAPRAAPRRAAWGGWPRSRGDGRVRRGDRVPRPGRAAADARRGALHRGRDVATRAAPDARAHAAAGALGRPGLLRLVRLALAGRSCSPAPRGGRCRPSGASRSSLASLLPAVVTYRWIEEPLRRSTLHVRRPRVTLAAAPRRPGARGRRGRRAVGEHLLTAARWRRARPRAPPSCADRADPAPPRGAAAAPARRRRRPRPGVRRRLPGRQAGPRVAGVRLRRPRVEDDRRPVRRLARDAVLPGARADRASGGTGGSSS